MTLRFLFLMDPIDRIDIHGDSTFVLMLESQVRGHQLMYAHPRALWLEGDQPWIRAQPVQVQRKLGDHFTLGEPEKIPVGHFDAVFMRKDPPFDVGFLTYTYLLDRVDQRRTVMVNNPQALRDFNEKLAALYWPELMPATIVAADREVLRSFIRKTNEAVVKPLDGAGGAGIVLLRDGDRNIGSVLDLLTEEGKRPIEAQAYVPAVVKGDKRLILLEGEPIGAVNRVPAPHDIRANMHVGGRAEASEITERDQEIARTLGPELKRRGLIFVGIDIIGGFLTEINVTSPTGLQEAGRFSGQKLETQIITRVEEKRAQLS